MLLFRSMELNNKDFEEIKELLKTHQTHSGFLTPDQAAVYLNVSKSMIYKLGSLNVFPRYKPTQGLVYYKKQDLDLWIENGRIHHRDLVLENIVKKVLDKNSQKSINKK